MASIPISQPSRPLSSESIEDRFLRLAALWQSETAHHSSSTVRYTHPAYREIIAMGKPVVPLLLHDLERTHRRWFTALQAITGAAPITPQDAGKLTEMVAAWLHWGRENGWIA
jgi:hypothetical protein